MSLIILRQCVICVRSVVPDISGVRRRGSAIRSADPVGPDSRVSQHTYGAMEIHSATSALILVHPYDGQ
jgi:hypothetical protein